MPAVPAALAVESNVAQNSDYLPNAPIALIEPHPRNVRHDARADGDLIESVAGQGILEPLLVAPHPETPDTWRLIAGHRRLDAAIRAKLTHVPAIVRYDLTNEADQVAAMLVENGRRAELTPVEEGEGFDLLTELGWKPDAIAQKVGRSVSTVNQRRKLTKLAPVVRGAVNGGQITIDDAIALAALPAAEQKKLEKLVNTGSWRYELRQAQDRVKRQAEVDKQRAAHLKAGIPEKDMPSGHSIYTINHADHGMVRIHATFSADPDDHPGCLAFVDEGTRQYPSLAFVCTDPAKHDDQLTDAQRERQAAEAAEESKYEQIRQEAREARERKELALTMRLEAAVAAVKPSAKLDPTLDALVRVALPALFQVEGSMSEGYLGPVNLPADLRWWENDDTDTEVVEAFAAMTQHQLIKVLVAWSASWVESSMENGALDGQHSNDEVHPIDRAAGAAYRALLAQVGHELNDVDLEAFAYLDTPTVADEAEEQPS